MSEQETVVGKFVELYKTSNMTIEEKCEQICLLNGKKLEDEEYYESYEELLMEEFYMRYFVYGDRVFELLEFADFDDDYYCNLTEEKDGVFSFSASFYNGGTYLAEVLGEALEELENDK